MFNNFKIFSFNDYVNYLGTPEGKIGTEYVWQCPYCKDSHRDNLKYSPAKNILMCFADSSHSQMILKEMHKKQKTNEFVSVPVKQGITAEHNTELTAENMESNRVYCLNCNDRFKNDLSAQEYLTKQREIIPDVAINYGIGLNGQKQWIIPMIKYSVDNEREIIGAEIRPYILPNAVTANRTTEEIEAKKYIKRLHNGMQPNCKSVSGLCEINNYTDKTECLIVVEGFLDGIILLQHLQEKGQDNYYQIVTGSNGIGSIERQLKEIVTERYKQFFLYIDNDDKSLPVAERIIEKYPYFKQMKLNCGCKDFNEHYVKCIKNKELAETSSGLTNEKVEATDKNTLYLPSGTYVYAISEDIERVIINGNEYEIPEEFNKTMIKYNESKTIEMMLRYVVFEHTNKII